MLRRLNLAFLVVLGALALPAAGRDLGVKILRLPAPPLAPAVKQLQETGVTAVFVRGEELFSKPEAGKNLREFRKLLGEAGIKFFMTVPIFLDTEALKEDPSLAGMGSFGNPSKVEGLAWYGFVCPNRPEYRKKKTDLVVALVRELRPDGLSLDFIRYFVHWEKTMPDRTGDSIEKFCFCDHCLRQMETELGFKFPADAKTRQEKAAWVLANHREKWTAWKCETITSMVRDTSAAAKAVLPGLKISLHGVPWTEKDYDEGRRVIAGQDLKKLAPYVDVFGPMTYFEMLQRKPEWVHEVGADYYRATGKAPLLSVQAVADKAQFEKTVLAGFAEPSMGVNVFSWERLSKDAEARKVLSDLMKK